MPLTERKFNLLSAIGIPLWQQRSSMKVSKAQPTFNKVDSSIMQQPLFQDILQALALSTAEIKVHDDHIDLGTSLWFFTPDLQVTFEQNKLITPVLTVISVNPPLKKRLWRTLTSKLIN